MSEKESEGYLAQAEGFAKDIKARKLPIEQEDAIAFARSLLQYNFPSGFLASMVRRLQFLDRDTFDTGLDQMAQFIASNFKNKPYRPYIGLVQSARKSGLWV